MVNHLFRYSLVLVPLLFLVTMCQELPTEPEPIDLSEDEPLARRDTVLVAEDDSVRAVVLANDTSLVGQSLKLVEITEPPMNGVASLLPDDDQHRILYKPNPDFFGTDSLKYRVQAEVLSAEQWLILLVTGVNDRPLAVDDRFVINETHAASKIQADLDVLANDLDIDGDEIAILVAETPVSGTVEVSADRTLLVFTPEDNFSGTVPFTYVITDNREGLDTANVLVDVRAVNDAPVATNDSYTLNEDQTLVIAAPGVLGNDIDVEGDALTASLVQDVDHGNLTFNADGSFRFIPEENFAGMDGFSYRAADESGVESDIAEVLLTIRSVNDPPEAFPDTFTVDRGGSLVIPAPGVLANDTDLEGNPLTARLSRSTQNGTLTLLQNGGFTYIPASTFSGEDSFTYRANDGDDSNETTVVINVASGNLPPVATDDQYVGFRNQELVVTAPGVLANDTDPDNDPLQAQLRTQVTNGALTAFNANGGFRYTPSGRVYWRGSVYVSGY